MPPHIDAYRFGEITIDGTTYRADVIVLPDRVVANCWRKEGHSLVVEDLAAVLAEPTGNALATHNRIALTTSTAACLQRRPRS